jgi:hypothetical protein
MSASRLVKLINGIIIADSLDDFGHGSGSRP